MAAKRTSTARRTTTTRRKSPTTKRRAVTTRRVRTEAPAARTSKLTGGMTVREAGRKGGLIGGRKGGETVKAERGVAFYRQIGRKGGQRVRELIEAGRVAMEQTRVRRRKR